MAIFKRLSDAFSSQISLSTSLSVLAVASLILYVTALAIWRLYLSPLAKIPGPRLAALTQWYETYLEIFKDGGGQFLFEYRKWHEKYGPVVRISPSEVHIQDPEFYEELYRKPYDKLERLKHRFNNSLSTFSTAGHGLHKRRRAALNPFFSQRKVADHGPVIQSHVDRLCDRLATEYASKNRVLVLNDLWGCLTSDTVVGYCFERSYHFIDEPDFMASFPTAMEDLVNGVHYVTQFPWLSTLAQSLPDSIVGFLSPAMRSVIDFNNKMQSQIVGVLHSQFDSKKEGTSHDLLFNALLQSNLPPEELSEIRLQHEAISVVGAGLETTKRALSVASFHILDNPQVLARLQEELAAAIPDVSNPPSLTELQNLPYLGACIEEALRLSYGTSQRGPRLSPTTSTQYGPYTIPPKTEISMSIYSITHDEHIFPDSHTFNPSRWLDNPKGPDGQKFLSRYMVSFGKGNRMCLGIHLAYAEIYIALAMVFRQFNMRLWDTDKADVECLSDMFVPHPRKGSQGVRVKVL